MSFFGSLFGGDQEKILKKGRKAALGEIDTGYNEALPRIEEAFNLYQPFAESGRQANTAYTNLLGLNGADAQRSSQDIYFQDPAQQQILSQKTNNLLRQLNARGGTYGGRAALAGARAGLENYNSYLDRVGGLANTGGQFVGQQATLRAGQGDMAYGRGLTKAGVETNSANALAQNKSTSVNNLLGLGSTLLKGASLFV